MLRYLVALLVAYALCSCTVLAQPLPRHGGMREDEWTCSADPLREARSDKGYRVRTYTSRPAGATGRLPSWSSSRGSRATPWRTR